MPFNSVSKINTGIISSCIIGLALSYYAYIVETSKEIDSSYEAMCDISEHISCTKAFMSEYGKGFGIIPKTSPIYFPNSVYGLLFYTGFAILSFFNSYGVTVGLVVLGAVSNLGSVYLGFILYMIQDICVVCISTYIVNAAILFFAVKKLAVIARDGRTSIKKKKN